MRILVINPIMYTSETRDIKRVSSIKDAMMYDLCLAFHEQGHEVTLFAGEPYRPEQEERYPFRVIWGKCILPGLFAPHRFPVMPEVYGYIKKNQDQIDMILSSEVFSANSLMAYWAAPRKLMVWHELAKHNALLNRIPSKIWYGFVSRFFMKNARIVPRSRDAQVFIQQYCRNVDSRVVDHGVNLTKFPACREKANHFVVCSQLIGRKRVDGIIRKFGAYVKTYDPKSVLYIIGDGELEQELRSQTEELGLSDHVIFTGRLGHSQLMPLLAGAQALLVNTEKDNNMISVVESIAVGTPVLTTDIPLNASYIKAFGLGVVRQEWDAQDLHEIVKNNKQYVENCINYREQLSTKMRVAQLLEICAEPVDRGNGK